VPAATSSVTQADRRGLGFPQHVMSLREILDGEAERL
jgi:hypothetical protein